MTELLLKNFAIIMLVSLGYYMSVGYVVMSKSRIKYMQIPVKMYVKSRKTVK